MIDLFDALTGSTSRMRHIQRYSSLPCLKPENVAEHSWQISFISMLIGMDLNERNGSKPVDMGKLLQRALVHDLSECMSGDIIRSYKHGTPEMRETMAAADDKNMYKLSRDYAKGGSNAETADEIYLHWKDSKDDSLEGHILAFADLVCVMMYCREEWRMGNRELDRVCDAARRTLMDKFGFHVDLQRYIQQLMGGSTNVAIDHFYRS